MSSTTIFADALLITSLVIAVLFGCFLLSVPAYLAGLIGALAAVIAARVSVSIRSNRHQ